MNACISGGLWFIAQILPRIIRNFSRENSISGGMDVSLGQDNRRQQKFEHKVVFSVVQSWCERIINLPNSTAYLWSIFFQGEFYMRRQRNFVLIAIVLITILAILPIQNQATTSAQQNSTGEFREILRLGRGRIHDVAWHPTEPLILVDTARGAWLYDKNLADVGYIPDVRLAHFSPDGQYIAAVSRDNQILLFNAFNRDLVHSFSGHSFYLKDIGWSPDNNFIATVDSDSHIIIWDIQDFSIKYHWHIFPSQYVRWSPDSQYIAVNDMMGNIHVWNIITGVKELEFERWSQSWLVRLEWINSSILLFTPTRGYASLSVDSFLLDIQSNEIISYESNNSTYQLDIDVNQNLWVDIRGRCGRIRNRQSLDITNELCSEDLLTANNISIQENGGYVAVGYYGTGYVNITDHELRLFTTGSSVPLVYVFKIDKSELIAQLPLHLGKIEHLVWSPHSNQLLIVDNTQTLRLWDIPLGTLQYNQKEHAQATIHYDLSPDSQYIAVADAVNHVNIWDINNNQHHQTLRGHSEAITRVLWRPESIYWSHISMIATHTDYPR